MRGDSNPVDAPPDHLRDHPRVRGEQNCNLGHVNLDAGSPPRARGADRRVLGEDRADGITPACAESSFPRPGPAARRPDHPRVRGEQTESTSTVTGRVGSPPRAPGADTGPCGHLRRRRITPACAGSRLRGDPCGLAGQDHPRVRGEQEPATIVLPALPGSPPRARGADRVVPQAGHGRRITPACAGSRPARSCSGSRSRDHPRVRGEQSDEDAERYTNAGSPPRARGADAAAAPHAAVAGITPACAGSSPAVPHPARRRRDHPRVRGEQGMTRQDVLDDPGSPPRARGAVGADLRPGPEGRITPACAGSRWPARYRRCRQPDHPRVRGEQDVLVRSAFGLTGITPACAGSRDGRHDVADVEQDHPRVRGEQHPPLVHDRPLAGSPPRARGAGLVDLAAGVPRRITPACAGSRRTRRRPGRSAPDHPRVRGEQAPRP